MNARLFARVVGVALRLGDASMIGKLSEENLEWLKECKAGCLGQIGWTDGIRDCVHVNDGCQDERERRVTVCKEDGMIGGASIYADGCSGRERFDQSPRSG